MFSSSSSLCRRNLKTFSSKNSLFTQTGICEASFESQIYMQCSSVGSVQILSIVNCFQLYSHMKKIFDKKIRKRKTQTKGLHLQRNSHLLKQFNSYMQTVPLSCTFSLTLLVSRVSSQQDSLTQRPETCTCI